MILKYSETKDKNILYNDFGMKLKTSEDDFYNIKNVYLFKSGTIYIIANYFYDNIENTFEIFGNIKRKLKEDLSSKDSFILKNNDTYTWQDTQYNLYINIEDNNYECLGLKLCNTQLNIEYKINNLLCKQCVGWNNKLSSKYKYNEFENAYKKINSYSIDNKNMEDNIKDLLKAYKNYKKALELEKTYTEKDYNKMRLVSGTTFIENYTMLVNNGYMVDKKVYNEEMKKEREDDR